MADKLDLYVAKLKTLDVKGVVEKAVAADKKNPSKKGQKLLAECNKLYVDTLKKSKGYDDAIAVQYDQCVDLIKQMTEGSLKQAQVKITAMQKLLVGAAAAYRDLEKAVVGIKKEYALS